MFPCVYVADPEGIANAQKSLGIGQEDKVRKVRWRQLGLDTEWDWKKGKYWNEGIDLSSMINLFLIDHSWYCLTRIYVIYLQIEQLNNLITS